MHNNHVLGECTCGNLSEVAFAEVEELRAATHQRVGGV